MRRALRRECHVDADGMIGGRRDRAAHVALVASRAVRGPATSIRVTAVCLVLLVAACGGGPEGGENGIEGLREVGGLSQEHVEDDVDYPHRPPLGGPHAGTWQNCGFYDAEVPEEQAVHSFEHGAVWITYSLQLADADVEQLRALAAEYVLVSPYPELPSPVVASAWGLQVRLDGVDDPRLERFIEQYANGEQSPEPGAPCSGGDGEPAAQGDISV